MKQLSKSIDSITIHNSKILSRISKEVFMPASFTGYMDTSWKGKVVPAKADTIKRFEQLVPDSLESIIHQRAQNKIVASAISNETILSEFNREERELRQHKIEWHRKISLSLACLVFFIIGAPLGAIIRKGGLGNSMISAIVFFMLFFFTGNTGEKFAREGAWHHITGMWFSTFILVPIGIFLTYKAVHDSQLFNKEFYVRTWKKLRSLGKYKTGNQIT